VSKRGFLHRRGGSLSISVCPPPLRAYVAVCAVAVLAAGCGDAAERAADSAGKSRDFEDRYGAPGGQAPLDQPDTGAPPDQPDTGAPPDQPDTGAPPDQPDAVIPPEDPLAAPDQPDAGAPLPSERPPPAYSEPAQPGAQVDEAVRELPKANIAFNVPKTLQEDETTEIALIMSRRLLEAALRRRLPDGKKEGARIRVSDKMEARLTSLSFDIEPLTPGRQLVGTKPTKWRWEIGPKKTGRLRLHLELTALVTTEATSTSAASKGNVPIRTFDRTLIVRSTPVPFLNRASGAFVDNLDWLVPLLLALATAAAGFLRKRSKRQSVGAEAPAGSWAPAGHGFSVRFPRRSADPKRGSAPTAKRRKDSSKR
jgi:hypothetical protein